MLTCLFVIIVYVKGIFEKVEKNIDVNILLSLIMVAIRNTDY